MRKTIMLWILLIWGGVTILYAEEAPPKTYSDESLNELKEWVRGICTAPVVWPDNKGYIQEIHRLVNEKNIPRDVYVNTLETYADEQLKNYHVVTDRVDYGRLSMGRSINLMADMGDLEFLPWLERQAIESQWPRVRESAAIAYVKIAGLDAVPFVRRILSGKDEKYDFHCKNLVSMEFFDQIANAEGVKAPQGKINAAYAMLIEQVLNEQNESIAWELDKHLAQHLPEYKASHQRNVVLSHFLQSPNEIARANFRKKQEELQKTPKAERTDLSKRFPGLAEVKLEDEQQTEATSPAEDK